MAKCGTASGFSNKLDLKNNVQSLFSVVPRIALIEYRSISVLKFETITYGGETNNEQKIIYITVTVRLLDSSCYVLVLLIENN